MRAPSRRFRGPAVIVVTLFAVACSASSTTAPPPASSASGTATTAATGTTTPATTSTSSTTTTAATTETTIAVTSGRPEDAVPGRNLTDRPDDSANPQLKVLYVLPFDGRDRHLDVDGTVERSISSTQTWLTGQSGGTRMRYDTRDGVLDIGFARLAETDAALAANGRYLRDMLERQLRVAGFDAPDKLYVVFYDGTADGICGGGAWPPELPGTLAAIYLHGAVPGPSPPCDSQSIGASSTVPAYLDIAALHEVFHTLGAVAECAPHETLRGHVAGNPDDFMYSGDEPWGRANNLILDDGRDDYWGHGRADCVDAAASAFLDPLPADPRMPPGWARARPPGAINWTGAASPRARAGSAW